MADEVNHIDYDKDGYGWATEQAALLRARRFSEIDLENIAEEIESVGKSERRTLESHLSRLMTHLLKWQQQPERRGNSWTATIGGARMEVADVLGENPSLKPHIAEMISKCYRRARVAATEETGIDETDFPAVCPWSFEQITDSAFWPEAGT